MTLISSALYQNISENATSNNETFPKTGAGIRVFNI